jgi:signal transduction histidine kinase
VLALTIADDGRGLPEHHLTGIGLTSMRERATELGGTFAITRAANGGTLLAVRLPLHGAF